MRLDVGCGARPTGDVNCDLFIKDDADHRNMSKRSLNVKGIPNFVLCDCRYLPFVELCFDTVFCSQVIEHLPVPVLLVRELVRVCSCRLIIHTTHYLSERVRLVGRGWHRKHHVSFFSRASLLLLVCQFGFSGGSYVLSRVGVPCDLFPVFSLPYEIGVEVRRV